MSTAPSARPPSSTRRQPDIDSERARQFVDGAASHPSAETPTGEEGQPDGRTETAPPRKIRREQLRPLTLRIPEELHNALLYIAENGSKSMNQFAIDALTPATELQMGKIARRKELGLD